MIDKKFINRFLYITLPFVSIYIITLVLDTYDIFKLMSGFMGVITPLIVAYILAAIVNPLVNSIEDKVKSRGLAILAVLTFAMIIIYVFLRLLVPLVVTQIAEIANLFPNIQTLLTNESENLLGFLKELGVNTSEISDSLQTQIQGLSTLVLNSINDISGLLGSMIGGLLSSIFKTILILTLFIYLLIDMENVNSYLVKFVPKKHRNYFVEIMTEISISINEYIKAMLIIMGFMFVMTLIGFTIIRVPNAFILAILVAVTNLIPFIGPYIGVVPAVLVGMTVSFNTVFLVILVIIIVQQIDSNIINPFFMNKTTHLHPVIIITGVLVFSYFMGLIGILIAIPMLSIFKIVYTRVNEKYHLVNFE